MKKPWFWIVSEIDPPAPQIHTIQRAVVAAFPGVTLNDINSARRTPEVMLPRHVAMFLCRELTLRSMAAIGRKFGDRDSTTVHHAIGKIKGLLAADLVLAAKVKSIRMELAA